MTDNTKGILWALVATAVFAVVAAMAKAAVKDYHVLQILFFRQIVVFASCLPALVMSFPGSLKTHHPGMHALRLAGAFTALSCSIWAVAVLPLTTAITLGFAQVFFVAILALCLLREAVGWHRIAAVVAGFGGVVIVMRPGVEGMIDAHALIPVLGALGAGFAVVSVRKLSQTESTATLLVYQALFVGALAGVPMFWLWETPDIGGALLLLTMGVLSSVGQWVGVRALRLGEASVIGNIQYMQLVYAAILGFFVFREIPDAHTIAGAAFIIGPSMYILHREALSKK